MYSTVSMHNSKNEFPAITHKFAQKIVSLAVYHLLMLFVFYVSWSADGRAIYVSLFDFIKIAQEYK